MWQRWKRKSTKNSHCIHCCLLFWGRLASRTLFSLFVQKKTSFFLFFFLPKQWLHLRGITLKSSEKWWKNKKKFASNLLIEPLATVAKQGGKKTTLERLLVGVVLRPCPESLRCLGWSRKDQDKSSAAFGIRSAALSPGFKLSTTGITDQGNQSRDAIS